MNIVKNDILVTQDGAEMKVQAICGELIFSSIPDEFEEAGGYRTKQEIKTLGWTVKKSKPEWKPEMKSAYWFVSDGGGISQGTWYDGVLEIFRWNTGNVFRTQKEATAHREKMLNEGRN